MKDELIIRFNNNDLYKKFREFKLLSSSLFGINHYKKYDVKRTIQNQL